MAGFRLLLLEGFLEEALVRRLLDELGVEFDPAGLKVAGGKVPFWKLAPKYHEAARYVGHVLGLTDLDQEPCPSTLIDENLGTPIHPNFILRIQVRALESWLLADHEGLAEFLHISKAVIPEAPDKIVDPKDELIDLARRCQKPAIVKDMVPGDGTARKVGPGYYDRVSDYISTKWSPARAAKRSPSLARAIAAIIQVAGRPDDRKESGPPQ
jgi:hypothetical protein